MSALPNHQQMYRGPDLRAKEAEPFGIIAERVLAQALAALVIREKKGSER